MTPLKYGEKGTCAKKVTLRDAKEDVDEVCIEVQKTSDNAEVEDLRVSSKQSI